MSCTLSLVRLWPPAIFPPLSFSWILTIPPNCLFCVRLLIAQSLYFIMECNLLLCYSLMSSRLFFDIFFQFFYIVVKST